MRTKEEVQKMLGKVMNSTTFMKEDTKMRQAKDKIYCFMQALNWVLVDGDELTEEFEKRIQSLRDEADPEPKLAVQGLAGMLMDG